MAMSHVVHEKCAKDVEKKNYNKEKASEKWYKKRIEKKVVQNIIDIFAHTAFAGVYS